MRRRVSLALAALLLPLAALAEDPYCRKVHARAAAEASRLMSPQLVVQALRYPTSLSGVPLDQLEVPGGTPYQARAGVAFSPLELVKGLELTWAADGDCQQHAAAAALEAFLENAEGSARLPALRSEATWLEARSQVWAALLAQAEGRFAGRVSTLLELNQVRTRATALERKLVQTRGEADRLGARGYQRPEASPRVLLQRWLDGALELERRGSGARALSFWNVRLTAGVVASERPVDWYGLAEVSVHLGAILQGDQERRYLDARIDELRHDPAELELRVFQLQRHLGLLREQARRELQLVEAQLASIAETRQSLERADSPNVAHATALLTFDQLAAESEQVYLATFIQELSALLTEEAHE